MKNVFFFKILFLILEYGSFYSGKPNISHEDAERVITNVFLGNCITATNAHGEEDKDFTKTFLREFLKGHLESSFERIFDY